MSYFYVIKKIETALSHINVNMQLMNVSEIISYAVRKELIIALVIL